MIIENKSERMVGTMDNSMYGGMQNGMPMNDGGSKKNGIRLWQFLVLLALSIGICITMFLPAFKINENAMYKYEENRYKNAISELKKLKKDKKIKKNKKKLEEVKNTLNDYKDKQKELKDEKEDFKDASKERLKDVQDKDDGWGISVSRISPFSIMTKGFAKMVYGSHWDHLSKSDKKDKDLKNARKAYNSLKIKLWIIYSVNLAVLIFLIIAFCVKMNKMVSLLVLDVLDAVGAVLFIYFAFGLKGAMYNLGIGIKRGGSEYFHLPLWHYPKGSLTDNKISDALNSAARSATGSFLSVAFLIGMIIAILFLAAGILSLFVGNQREIFVEDMSEDFGGYAPPFGYPGGSGSGVPQQGEVFGEVDINRPNQPIQPVPQPQNLQPIQPIPQPQPQRPQPQPVSPALGQVKCTKGVAMGQGFMLPVDKKVIIGKSPQRANLVINHQNVSNVHCSIRYDASRNIYIVKDHSSNGTFVNGVRLQNGVPMEYPAGTVLTLADGSNQVTLG